MVPGRGRPGRGMRLRPGLVTENGPRVLTALPGEYANTLVG
jgi:hypothetical protein